VRVRQQIQKTQAHLTGAQVPSSDERWNHSDHLHKVLPWDHRNFGDGSLRSSFEMEDV
jgi:hypothetical protein